ncbi:MAG: K(+)-transporting ATPase subunit F [Fimbriimonadaceae bacterium]|nr:K(+)-transporting ATPase subunit F [Fimbriimonadaceae bacterium]
MRRAEPGAGRMTVHAVAGLLASLLLAYLFMALLKPEKF